MIFDESKLLPHNEYIVWIYIRNGKGAANGITQSALSSHTNLPKREVRRAVKNLVETYGLFICSGNTGFYVPETMNEVSHTKKSLLAKAHSILKRVSKLDKNMSVDTILGQIELLSEKA